MFKAEKIREGIYWVGAIDWNLRNFHGYSTPRGSTYNAYLIIDEKITLIDTVKSYLTEEMIERIASVVDPAKIDIVISNHVEMDHSGGLPRIMQLAPQAKLYCSPQGEKGLKEHYRPAAHSWNFHSIKTGESVSLGKRSLSFVQTPMIHWPDNMVGYMPEEKILFSNDSFGQHFASSERYDDEVSLQIAIEEAQKYYGNIVLSYNEQVKKELEAASHLDIQMICSSHGLIWRSHVAEIVKHYTDWAYSHTKNEAVVVYDSMWGSTQKMANAIAEGFELRGIRHKKFDLNSTHISDVMTHVVTSKYIAVGSPTLNSNLMPTVAGFLTYLRALSPRKRTALAFGSYGWGGQSIDQVETYLKECGFEILPQQRCKYIPDEQQLAAITEQVAHSIP